MLIIRIIGIVFVLSIVSYWIYCLTKEGQGDG